MSDYKKLCRDLEITSREIDEFNDAWKELFMECCYALKLDVIVEWLNDVLKRWNK